MKWNSSVLAAPVIALVLTVPRVADGRVLSGGAISVSGGERIPGVLIVNFKPGVRPQTKSSLTGVTGIASIDALNSTYKVLEYREQFPGADPAKAPKGAPDLSGFHIFTLDPSVDLDQAASEFLDDHNVASVEYDFYATIMREPDDPSYSSMSNLDNTLDRDIDAPEAWDKSVGDPTVILADTDTGVLYNHPDLYNNIWVNPGEDLDSDGVVMDPDDINGIDDDGNGYIDDFIGYDFVAGGANVWPGEDGTVQDNDPIDFNGHGTHTSGTFGAVTNNGVGVAGIAGGFGPGSEPGCRIMCLRMGYSFVQNDGTENGRTHMSYAAQAFRYAADNGAVAINYSFGSSNGGGIDVAADYAIAAGLLISASAGNDNGPVLDYLQNRPDVMCVASVTHADIKSSFSNYGPQVDVSAPGSLILSTVSNHYSAGYAFYSGTSMAAPHIVGLVGLMKSLNPALTGTEIFDRIVNTTEYIDGYNPTYAGLLGSGRVNADLALANIAITDFDATPRIGPAPLTVNFSDQSVTPATAWHWDYGDGDSSIVQNPVHTYAAGLYDVSLLTETGIGNGLKIKSNFVAALAETLTVDSVDALPLDTVVIEIYAMNNLPVTEITLPINATNVSSSSTARMDSITTTGCRTSGFNTKVTVFNNIFFGQVAYLMRADGAPDMPPGDGPIAKVWFRINADATPGNPVIVTTDPVGGNDLEFVSPAVTYSPVAFGGGITLASKLGDFDFNGVIDVFDVIELVEVVFRSGPLPSPASIADINCDGNYDVFDVVALVDTAFRNAPDPVCP